MVLIFKLSNLERNIYRAFCAGSIITDVKVLSSANCFLTNRKAYRHNMKNVKVVGGVLQTMVEKSENPVAEQWRSIIDIKAQRFYRFPAYNLAMLIMDEPWIMNRFVHAIPFASVYYDFDGVCVATAVKATKSWSAIKYVYSDNVHMIKRRACEKILQRSCRNYFCTEYSFRSRYAVSETEGGGLVCHETGDPQERENGQGLLVGVTSVINIGLPNLYTRIGSYSTWIKGGSCKLDSDIVLIVLCIMILINNF